VSGEDAAIIKEVLIRETPGLAVMMVILWYFGPGRDLLSRLRHQVKARMGARGRAIDNEVAQFRNQVSRWDHEQAAQADHRPGYGGAGGIG
jgi:hypothetical protein